MKAKRASGLLACLLAGAVAGADVGPKPRSMGDGIVPPGTDRKDVEVEMTAEEVELTLRTADIDGKAPSDPMQRREALEVLATFHLSNPGARAAFEEGFPVGPINNMKGFAVEIDGKAVPTQLIDRKPAPRPGAPVGKEEDHDWWYVWPAEFPEHGTGTHVVRYTLDLWHWSDYRWSGYVLHTGAAWKNPIGKAVVTLRCGSGFELGNIQQALPVDHAQVKDGALVWTYEKFEPTQADDVQFVYSRDMPKIADPVAAAREIQKKSGK